jgi:hypothetical protein
MTTTSRGHVLPDLEHWTASMEARHQSPQTIKRRTGTLNSFAEFIGRDARTATPDDVTLFLASDPGWSKATKAAYYSDLHAYWTWLILTDREDASPTAKVQRPRMPVGLPRPCDTRDLMRALAVATGDDRAMILLGCYGALRCSEIAAVRGEDFIAGLLWVPDGKGGDPAAVAAHPLLAEGRSAGRDGGPGSRASPAGTCARGRSRTASGPRSGGSAPPASGRTRCGTGARARCWGRAPRPGRCRCICGTSRSPVPRSTRASSSATSRTGSPGSRCPPLRDPRAWS